MVTNDRIQMIDTKTTSVYKAEVKTSDIPVIQFLTLLLAIIPYHVANLNNSRIA